MSLSKSTGGDYHPELSPCRTSKNSDMSAEGDVDLTSEGSDATGRHCYVAAAELVLVAARRWEDTRMWSRVEGKFAVIKIKLVLCMESYIKDDCKIDPPSLVMKYSTKSTQPPLCLLLG